MKSTLKYRLSERKEKGKCLWCIMQLLIQMCSFQLCFPNEKLQQQYKCWMQCLLVRSYRLPLYHKDILAEYDEVLHRSKFHFIG